MRQRVLEAAPARRRIHFIALALAVLFAVLGLRLVWLAAFTPAPEGGWQAAAIQPPLRANLQDRNGEWLAVTIPAYRLIARPAEVWDAPEVAKTLVKVLPHLDRKQVLARLQRDKSVVYIARGLTQRQRDAVFEHGLPGIDFEPDSIRFYPQTHMAAHLLGAVNYDFQGAAGLERALEPALAGQAGAIRLSLDLRIQYALEAELKSAMLQTQSIGAAGVLLDGRSGEVLAIASLPTFDANAPPGPKDALRLNRALAANYEFGSILKPFVAASALEARAATTQEMFDPRRQLAIGGRVLADEHPADAPVSLAGALASSSNTVFADLALRLDRPRLMQGYARFGLTERGAAQAAPPEMTAPLLPKSDDPGLTASLGYGYGLALSPLRLAAAYTAFCNDGARIEPTFLARAGEPVTRARAVSAETAREMVRMMRQAVIEGTGKRADIAEIAIAGKTGTAFKAAAGGYDETRRVVSFAGLMPAASPRYVIVIMLDEPRHALEGSGPATGGSSAAPVAGRLAARIAPFLDVTIAAQNAPLAKGVPLP